VLPAGSSGSRRAACCAPERRAHGQGSAGRRPASDADQLALQVSDLAQQALDKRAAAGLIALLWWLL
jgi:hypothetical protein